LAAGIAEVDVLRPAPGQRTGIRPERPHAL